MNFFDIQFIVMSKIIVVHILHWTQLKYTLMNRAAQEQLLLFKQKSAAETSICPHALLVYLASCSLEALLKTHLQGAPWLPADTRQKAKPAISASLRNSPFGLKICPIIPPSPSPWSQATR